MPQPSHDILQRFMFPELACRGEIVRLTHTWEAVLARASYPAAVQSILGEALAATALLSATIKFDGSLSLQINGKGSLRMLLCQARSGGGLRGLARVEKDLHAQEQPLFAQARLAITIETGSPAERYQGVVDMADAQVSHALETYFERSEQLATRLWLTADDEQCAGILLQRLPDYASQDDTDAWRRLCMLTDTIKADELIRLPGLQILRRLYNQETVQLLDSQHIQFGCTCSRERTAAMLIGLGEDEVQSILQDESEVDVRCEFCNAQYRFDASAVRALFSPARTSGRSPKG
ncbi:MAG: Hsp33 family molecular chaperone HslO [Gammaproteobacteria bacterium]|nr:Hsp33 family molecular chaperone HslO [Gammaproteobacteria bacterium]